MANKAVVNDTTGLVENIIVVDGPFDPGAGLTLVDPTGAQIGGTWDGTKFTSPPPLPPDANALLDIAIDSAVSLVDLKAVLSGQVAAR